MFNIYKYLTIHKNELPLKEEKDIKFEFNIPEKPILISGDKEKLREVIQNIKSESIIIFLDNFCQLTYINYFIIKK